MSVVRERRESGTFLRDALEGAVAPGGAGVPQLCHAESAVAFTVEGGGERVVVQLRGERPRVDPDDDAAADVEVRLTTGQAERFAVGQYPLPEAVQYDEISTSGPVRRYLEVDVIMRALLERGAAGSSALDRGTPPAPRRVQDEVLAIETRNLHKGFGGNPVLAGVDLRIPEGVISVILGPSGTGKSVTLRHVVGLLKPDEGDVLVRGEAVNRMKRAELRRLRRGIGVMFQDGALFSAMNVYDNVAFPLRRHTDMNEREIRERVVDHLASVGLADAVDRLPSQLSGGMKKRAGLARSLALEPGILLVDEPDSGLDPVRTALLGELLVEQHQRYGGTVVVVTHNVSLARTISEHISVLWRGKVLETGTARQILASESDFVQQFLAGATEGPLGMDA